MSATTVISSILLDASSTLSTSIVSSGMTSSALPSVVPVGCGDASTARRRFAVPILKPLLDITSSAGMFPASAVMSVVVISVTVFPE